MLFRSTRQTSQGARQTAHTVEHMVKLSEQLNEALSQFRITASAGGGQERASTEQPAGVRR